MWREVDVLDTNGENVGTNYRRDERRSRILARLSVSCGGSAARRPTIAVLLTLARVCVGVRHREALRCSLGDLSCSLLSPGSPDPLTSKHNDAVAHRKYRRESPRANGNASLIVSGQLDTAVGDIAVPAVHQAK